MTATADKFSRLAALKPARAMPARPSSLRAPDEADALGRLLGAGVSKNRFGEHLAVRNWFSTPEFSEPSPVALELLSRTRDEALSRKTRAALSDPAKWLFLDTETTGLAGGTGTSFDWPLLENRFTMTRSIAVPRLAAHLDLLHPARALWKLRLGSVRLVELERRVLDAPRIGWHREDDVEAALIPQLYFDYLRGGPAEPLAGVVRHNQMDL